MHKTPTFRFSGNTPFLSFQGCMTVLKNDMYSKIVKNTVDSPRSREASLVCPTSPFSEWHIKTYLIKNRIEKWREKIHVCQLFPKVYQTVSFPILSILCILDVYGDDTYKYQMMRKPHISRTTCVESYILLTGLRPAPCNLLQQAHWGPYCVNHFSLLTILRGWTSKSHVSRSLKEHEAR